MRSTPSPFLLLSLVLVMAGAAFALGIGVTGILGDDEVAASVRAVPGSADPALIQTTADESSGDQPLFTILDEVYAILDRDFVDPDEVDLDDFRTAAINGIVAALDDPHSAYIDAETFALSSESILGVFEGIGATVNLQDAEIVITSTFRGSPAEAVGIRAGDAILTVDGESTEGWSLQLAVSVIRGERGTPVVLGIRHRDGEMEEITVIRDNIIVPSVQSLQVDDRLGNAVTDIAYILITQYTANTRDELIPFLDAIRNAGLTQVIIDLRGNPGGLLTATVETTGEFIDGGVVLTQVDRDGSTRDFEAPRGGSALDVQIAILTDGGSASGSEVMAAALRDHGRAVIIGEQTLGKGTVNIPRSLSDDSVLYVSTARWLTPKGELIEEIGVTPDIVVTPTDDDFNARRDVQLFAAIEFLRGSAQNLSE